MCIPACFLRMAFSEGHKALLATIVLYNSSTSLGNFNMIDPFEAASTDIWHAMFNSV